MDEDLHKNEDVLDFDPTIILAEKIITHIEERYEKEDISTASLFFIIDRLSEIGKYDIKTIVDCGIANKISYPATMKRIKTNKLIVKVLLGVKFVIEKTKLCK